LSWFYYTYDALLIELWSNQGAIGCSAGTNATILCKQYKNGDQVLALYNVKKVYFTEVIFLIFLILIFKIAFKSDLTRDILCVLAIGIFLRILAYVILAIKARRK
jgi:hypothetical protein